ncbi:hypothetical protein FQZ97_922820 [compost metagenome]
MEGQRRPKPVELDTIRQALTIRGEVRVAHPVPFDQLQPGAEHTARAFIVRRSHQQVAADHRGDQRQGLKLVVVQGRLGIALQRIVGIEIPCPIQ